MDTRCPICWLAVVDDVFECPGCGTPQHVACVSSVGGCVVAGCVPASAGAAPGKGGHHVGEAHLIPGNPDRWVPKRMLDAFWTGLAIFPGLLVLLIPLTTFGMLPAVLGFYGMVGRTIWFVTSVVSFLVLMPAIILLSLEPELRRAGLARLKDRVLDAYLRFLPAAIPSLLFVVLPTASPRWLITWLFDTLDWGTALVYTLVGVLAIALVQVPLYFALVIACLPRELEPSNPIVRAVSLLARRPVSAFGALVAAAAIPGYLAAVLYPIAYSNLGRLPMGGLLIGLFSATVGVFLTRIWPMAYLCLLHRDLTARGK